MAATLALRMMRGSRAAFASPTRLNAAATRRSAAIMSGRRSSISSGRPAGIGAGQRGEVAAGREFGGGITAEQQLERAQRLLVGEPHLLRRVLEVAEVGARERDILLVAGADLPALLRQRHQFLRGLRPSPRRSRSCEPGLAGGEPALRDRGRQRLPAELEVGLRRGVGRLAPRCVRSASGPTGPAPTTRRARVPCRAELTSPPPMLRPPVPNRFTAGRSAALASSTYCAACSTRVAVTRRSGLLAIASATSASSCASPNVASQLSAMGPAERRPAFQAWSRARFGERAGLLVNLGARGRRPW